MSDKGTKRTCADLFLDNLSSPAAQSDDPDIDMNDLFPDFHQGSKVLIEGYLEKRGSWNTAWKTRYFVLEASGRLFYFITEADKCIIKRVRGIIPIDVRAKVKGEGLVEDGRNEIRIHVPGKGISSGRIFILSARDKMTYDTWLHQLSLVQDKVIYTSFPENVRHW